MEASTSKHMKRADEERILGVFFDGKLDKQTKIMKLDDETQRYYSGKIKEEHYSVTWEPSGKYLFHFTPEKPEGNEKPAQKIAQPIYEWLVERGLQKDLVLVSGDSTSTITGTWGGAIRHLEILLKRKCHWDICMLHINELPLRCLIIKLDGPYIPKQGWTGPLGKLIEIVGEIEVNPNFPAFPEIEDLILLPEEVVSKLSTDQKNCYRLHAALKSGILPPELAKIKCGELSQSRWLTTAQAFMMLWTRFHNVEGENSQKT